MREFIYVCITVEEVHGAEGVNLELLQEYTVLREFIYV
jgi:hypothetical protein